MKDLNNMALISQDNVNAGLEMLRRQLLNTRTKLKYIIKHEPDSLEKEALLDEMEKEIGGLTDCVNLLTSLRQ
ncbi:hypothetical protein LCGC14_1891880 [marine sediment metagenome]|uniref:Uncharacterized protein n=1 Tax=marine sediment metagenome TaxID=412755 RepID=A0A0F9GMF2_9ZZZZ